MLHWLPTLQAVSCPQAADPSPWASWFQENAVMVRTIHLPETVPPRSSGKGEPLVGIIYGGGYRGAGWTALLQEAKLLSSLHGRCCQTVQKPLHRGGYLCARQVISFRSFLFGLLAAAVGPRSSKICSNTTDSKWNLWGTSSWDTNQVQHTLLSLKKGSWGFPHYRKAEYTFSLFMDV